jgi:peptide deformylase
MAIKKVVIAPNKILTTPTKPVTKIDASIKTLARDLRETLLNATEPEGAGLAANQIGVAKRVCVVRNFLSDVVSEEFVLINPKIISKSKDVRVDWEGCMSVPDKWGKVQRHVSVKVEAQTLDGSVIQISAKDLFAQVVQHEVDHLDGILFTSKVVGKVLSTKELDKLINEQN